MLNSQHSHLTPPAPESQTSPFSCNICHKTYTRVDHLARHVRSHTQEKPFPCLVCGKAFARADLLKRHGASHEEDPDGRKRRRLNQPQSRVAQACVACASSKLRCSGNDPCSRCHQKNIECYYNKPRTSIIADGSLSHQDQLGSQSPVSHDEWHLRPLPAHHHVTASPQFHQGQQPVASDPSQHVGEANLASAMVGMVQPPTQLPTPSSSGQPMDIGGYPDPMYDVANNVDQYDSSFAAFLKDVMMPDSTGQESTQHALGMAKQFPHFDLLDFANDESLSIFNTNYDVHLAPRAQPSNTDSNRQDPPQQNQGSSGRATPSASAAGIVLGAQAFKESVWLYAPSKFHHVGADQSNMFMPLEHLITKTRYRGPPPCETLAPAVRDRILTTILAESSTTIVPDLVTSFPSPELLTNLIHQCLIRHERQEDAWIHTPTFNPNEQNPEFLMGLVAAGAAYSEIPQIRNLGYAFQESTRRSVTEQIERDNRSIRYLRPLQTYALHLDVGLWSGDRRRMELSESHAFIMVTMIRRGNFLRQTSKESPAPDPRDTPEVTENKWKQWVERESFKRLATHLFIRDAQTSITLLIPPMISPSEILVELPASADLWRAKSATEWKNLYLAKFGCSRGPIPTVRAATDDFSLVTNFLDMIDIPLTNLLVLCSLWSLSWQYRELTRLNISNPGGNSSLVTRSLYQEIVQALQRFKLYSSDWMSGTQPLAIVLHERVLLNLHASLEDVQLFAGKAGEEEARRVYPVLVSWAQSRESRQAVWYAGQIFKAAKEYPKRTLQDFSAVSLYHAGLVFWAYSVVSGHSSPSTPQQANSRENQQIVFVDGDDNSSVQRFLVLGRGYPCLNASTTPTEKRVIAVDDAKAIMVTITDLLKRNNAGSNGKDEELSPLVSNLNKLMQSLGNAAKGIKIVQHPPAHHRPAA